MFYLAFFIRKFVQSQNVSRKKAFVRKIHLFNVDEIDYRSNMTVAVAMYEKKARDLWLFDYPAQVWISIYNRSRLLKIDNINQMLSINNFFF